MKSCRTYPKSEEIFKFLEECEKNGIGDKPSERPVDLLRTNYGMPNSLAVEYQREFYERKRNRSFPMVTEREWERKNGNWEKS